MSKKKRGKKAAPEKPEGDKLPGYTEADARADDRYYMLVQKRMEAKEAARKLVESIGATTAVGRGEAKAAADALGGGPGWGAEGWTEALGHARNAANAAPEWSALVGLIEEAHRYDELWSD